MASQSDPEEVDEGQEEEEEEEDVSFNGEEEEEEDDEDVPRPAPESRKKPAKSLKRLKDRGGSRKRGSASAFLDVAAEEEEEEEGDDAAWRQKRSRFIDDIAEVDEEEEDDELEEDGLEDLIDDAGEQAHDAVDMVALRRQMREAEAQAAQDAELNPEALQEYLKSRYGGQARQYYGGGGAGDEDLGAVAQQALLPKPSDPKLWVVRCAEGSEREVAVCLLQKAYDLAARGRPLLVKSAFCQDHLKGYMYVEAFKEAHVAEALRGLRAVFQSYKPRMVPLEEMTAALAVQAPKTRGVEPDSWVRLKTGLYKNDLARVVDLDASGERAIIKLVPRLDLAALDARAAARAAGTAAPAARGAPARPAPRGFNPDEARQFRSLDVLTQRDRGTGELVTVLNGSQRFQEGYLIKSAALKSLALVEGVPPLDELQRFQAAATTGAKGAAAPAEDLASLVRSLTTAEGGAGGGAAGPAFAKGDTVLVVQGDLAGIRGRVEGEGEGGLVMVRPEDAKLPGFTELVGFQPRELQKHFEPGTHVRVASGAHAGETGMVVSSAGGVVTLFADVSREEVKALARDLAPAAAVAAGAQDALGPYELHDLVALDAATVGVIVGVDRDACRVLTNQGRPEKPDVRVCRLPDLKRKLNDRRAAAQDGARNEVAAGDIVEVVDGPLRARSGTVRYVVRGLLFLQCRDVSEHAGFVCVQARHCRVRGGRRPVSAANPLATPARHADPYATPGALASPARGAGGFGAGGFGARRGAAPGYGAGARVSTSADRMLEGRVITIRQGPHRGMRGRVISSTPTHLRLELEAQMKTVTVDRTHVGLEDGGLRREAGADAGYGAGATPARAGATPARWAGATPLRPTATPVREALTRTPAYDPAWAATPAHPGFGAAAGGLPGSPRRDTPGAARYHADTPGSSHVARARAEVAPSSYGAGALAAPSPYSPSPALTPGLAATPGLSFVEAGVAEAAAPRGPAAPAAAADLGARWRGVEVSLPDGARGVVEAVEAGRASVRRGAEAGRGAWAYEARDGPVLEFAVADLEPVVPQRGDTVKLLQGDLAGKSGELVGTDGGDGIVKLGPEIKIWELAHAGRVVPGY